MTAARVCVVLGGGLVVLSALTVIAGAPQACGGLPSSYAPIVAFELARTAEDFAQLFGRGDSSCRRALVAALHQVNVLDVALFIPAYSAFLSAYFLSRRSRFSLLARVGVGVVLFNAAADVAENVCLFALEDTLDDASSPWVARLMVATSAKWLALGVIAVLSALTARGTGWPSVVAAASGALGLATPVLAVMNPTVFGRFVALGVAVSWAAMLLVAAVTGVRSPGAQ